MADGFIFAAALPGALSAWERIRELLKEAGRPIAGFDALYLMQNHLGHGLAGQLLEETIGRWQDAGGTHVAVVTMGHGFTTTDQHIAHLAEARRHFDGR